MLVTRSILFNLIYKCDSAVANIPDVVTHSAYTFADKYGRYFQSPKPIIKAVAILAVIYTIKNYVIFVDCLSRMSGVATSAVFRCLYRAGDLKGLIKTPELDWCEQQKQLKVFFP